MFGMKEVKKIFARQLRKESTKAEKIVWELIRSREFMGLKFRRQHVIEGFVLDFYCHEMKLGIEIDGSVHFRRKDHDKLRQEVIESENINIIRITNKEIAENKRSILEKIKEAVREPITPSPFGRGM